VSKFEHRDNTGTLFKNERREKDSHPNARGEAMIDGVLYEVAAWTKQGKKGPFQSLSFKRIEQDQHRKEPPTPKSNRLGGDEFMDDVPF
jgi:hypothetical protein